MLRVNQAKSRRAVAPAVIDHIGALREARDREIGLDAPARIEPLRVDDAPRLDGDVVGAYALQDGLGVAALHEELAERGHVEEADLLRARRDVPRAEGSNQFCRP